VKALITVDNGKMFRLDTDAHQLTLMDNLGKPITTRSIECDLIVAAGAPFRFSCNDGTETTEGKVIQVIYSR
jgi:hypothetical protein